MPIFDWNDDTPIEQAIYEAVGRASVAWEKPEGAGIFDSTAAKEIGDELAAFVVPRILALIEKSQDVKVEDRYEPRLGYATTEELFRELITRLTFSLDDLTSRVRVYRGLILAEMLGGLSDSEREYRTVDSH